jgi:hypothetical protein
MTDPLTTTRPSMLPEDEMVVYKANWPQGAR